MDSIYRSRVLVGGAVVAILPTWSDGAIVAAAARRQGRTDITVENGEWHGSMRIIDAPVPTHSTGTATIRELGLEE